MILPPVRVHGTAVACGEHGLLIIGAPGSGKSALALDLVALGAVLIADDLVEVQPGECPKLAYPATAPRHLCGMIEARGFGLVRVPHAISASLTLAIDLDQRTDERMPDPLTMSIAGATTPKLRTPATLQPAAVLAILTAGGLTEFDPRALAHT